MPKHGIHDYSLVKKDPLQKNQFVWLQNLPLQWFKCNHVNMYQNIVIII